MAAKKFTKYQDICISMHSAIFYTLTRRVSYRQYWPKSDNSSPEAYDHA